MYLTMQNPCFLVSFRKISDSCARDRDSDENKARSLCPSAQLIVLVASSSSPSFPISPQITMADINAIAQQFTQFYYNTFDTDRASLQSLYVRLSLIFALLSMLSSTHFFRNS